MKLRTIPFISPLSITQLRRYTSTPLLEPFHEDLLTKHAPIGMDPKLTQSKNKQLPNVNIKERKNRHNKCISDAKIT